MLAKNSKSGFDVVEGQRLLFPLVPLVLHRDFFAWCNVFLFSHSSFSLLAQTKAGKGLPSNSQNIRAATR